MKREVNAWLIKDETWILFRMASSSSSVPSLPFAQAGARSAPRRRRFWAAYSAGEEQELEASERNGTEEEEEAGESNTAQLIEEGG
jgi:hypothetical protein